MRAMMTAVLVVSASLAASGVWADGEGTARIDPAGTALAGQRGTWTITYEPGPDGMKAGGGIRLALSGYPIRLFAAPQCDAPAGANYVTARCTNEEVPVDLRHDHGLRRGWQQVDEMVVTVGPPGLMAEERLVLVYGDTSGGGPGGQTRWPEGDGLPVRIYSDTDGDGRFAALEESPRLTLVGGIASKLAAYGPSQAVVGEPTKIAVSARDTRNAVATEGAPKVVLTSAALGNPVEVGFADGKRAAALVEVVFREAGVHRLEAKPASAGGPPRVIEAGEFASSSRRDADTDPGFVPELGRVEATALEVRPGSAIRVVAHWRNAGTEATRKEYRISCHLERRPAKGRALVNWDHNPAAPTTQWQPGKEITDTHACPFPKDVPPGEHALTIGLYVSPEPGKFSVVTEYDVCRIRVGPEQPLVTDIIPARSNPIEVLEEEPQHRRLWGDTHCHTENSGDGSGSVRGLYEYARDVSRLDFCACSDHVGVRYPPRQWRQIQEMAKRFNDPGRFVSILGYEWSNADHGDKNVYYTQDDEPIRVPESGQAEDFFAMLAGVDCVVIPHHPAYPVGLRGADYGRMDRSLVPVVEMCSTHGLAEYLGNPRAYGRNKPMGPSLPGGFAQDALARGMRLGFICSSDDHSAHAGKIGFLAAVYADSFDRDGIIGAIRARRCYGSTGPRIVIHFAADGEPMGSVIDCERPPRLAVKVHGTAPLELVEIVKDGEVCYSERPGREFCEFTYRGTALDRPESYYYVRVKQSDGEMAWASPIFVTNAGPLPKLVIEATAPRSPAAGEKASVSATVRNEGRADAEPGVVRFMLDGPPSVPVGRERPPAKSGIGGLMATAGLQVWRWPVDEAAVNLFVRWGGDEEARDCSGEIAILDAERYIFTPFHSEAGDQFEDSGDGVIRWATEAEPGTGDGLNVWVRIDPRKRTRVRLDATRGGERRPGEVFTRAGSPDALPFELEVVDHDADRWIGEAPLPALKAGERRQVQVDWTPAEAREGRLICEVVGADGKGRASNAAEAPTVRVR